MGSKFNPVMAEDLHRALLQAGFTKAISGREIVFERANHNISCLKVRVFTSAHVGYETVAKCGKDAIRIVLLYTRPNGSTSCVKRGKRVFRVGQTEAIINRMLERARELYGMANQMAKIPRCVKCGAPNYPESKTCADYCWKGEKR